MQFGHRSDDKPSPLGLCHFGWKYEYNIFAGRFQCRAWNVSRKRTKLIEFYTLRAEKIPSSIC